MLCYRDPFHKSSYPYRSSIESVHGLTPDVDFIYFDDTQDLTNKISEILSDYDNPKYKKMVDSAYNKTMELCDLDVIYEKYLVPLAEKGKSEHVER